jgi:predicted alpha/beta superfamily hydrolase
MSRGARRAAAALGALALVILAALAAWQIRAWRDREREAVLREAHTLSGRVERHPDFRSEALGGTRRVWVYLPPQYLFEPERRFPVLYLQDGQNVFDGATAFIAGMEWEVDEAAQKLIGEKRIEPLIVVAVDNGGERRADEYLPTRDPRVGQGGEADDYGRMLVEELKPWIDRTYRTRPGRESTAIGGSSFGAIASLHLGLRHAQTFGGIAAVSPSVWWDGQWVLRFVAGLPSKPDTRVWVDVGTREGPRAVPDTRQLKGALVARGWQEGRDLRYVEAEGAEHNEAAWARRVPRILEFLFPPATPPAAGP